MSKLLPLLIGICGKKHSGKDSAFAMIHNARLPSRATIRYSFADRLKEEVSRATGKSLLWIEENKRDMRLILQGWGTDFRRKHFGENYWVDMWEKGYHNLANYQPEALIVATDVRFKNEADKIKELGGLIIRIVAVNKPFEEHDSHPSETDMDSYPPDLLWENDFTPGVGVFKLKQEIERLFKNV